VRDEQHLLRVMSTNPSFLQSSVDSQVRNLRDTGIPAIQRHAQATLETCRAAATVAE
jgi:hypothetical protein